MSEARRGMGWMSRGVPIGALLQRELFERVRTPGHFVMRTMYVVILFAVVALFGGEMSVFSTGGTISRAPEAGRLIFGAFSAVQFALALLVVPLLGAGAIAEERVSKSLGLLMLTELSPLQIVLGKFTARMGVVVLLLLSNIPVLALALIFGGVEPVEVMRVFVLTSATAAQSIGVTTFASAVRPTTTQAAIASYGVMLVLMVSLFGLIELDIGWYIHWHTTVTLFVALTEPLNLGSAWWIASLVNVGVGGVALLGATLAMRWKSRRVATHSASIGAGHAPHQVWDNPVAWREWSIVTTRTVGWAVLVLLAGCVLALLSMVEGDAEVSIIVGTIATNVVALASCVVALTVASGAFSQEKREQTLALLGLTFMRPSEIVAGKLMGVARRWAFAVVFMLPIGVGIPLVFDRGPVWFVVAPAFALAVVMFFLGAVGLFYGLVATTPLRAALPSVGTFVYLLFGMQWWPMIALQDEDALGVAAAVGWLVVFVPMLAMLARASAKHVRMAAVMVTGWIVCLLGMSVLADNELLPIALHPLVVVNLAGASVVERSIDSEAVMTSLSGMVLLIGAGLIFCWASSAMLSVGERRLGESEASPVLAAVLSLLVPGAGQFYMGRSTRGAVWMVGGAVSGCLAGLVNVASAVDAFQLAHGERDKRAQARLGEGS